MTRTFALLIAASVAFGSGAAAAANMNLSQSEQAKLQNLSPEAREYVLSRMGPEQNIDELIETTRLNNAAAGGFAGSEDVQRFQSATADRPWMDGDVVRSSDMYRPEPGMHHSTR